MKTYEIKTPTAELLIVQLPYRATDFSVLDTGEALAVCAFDENDDCLDVKGISKDYTLLGKPNEIKEEDAMELFYNPIDSTNLTHYANLRNLFSLLESEIYWDVNPISQYLVFIGNVSEIDKQIALQKQKRRFEEAEQKTFDKNRTLIFVKN